MKIGYARVSTTHQQHSLEAQLEKLETAGCEKIFSEEVSAVSSKRPAFEEAINFCREGDVSSQSANWIDLLDLFPTCLFSLKHCKRRVLNCRYWTWVWIPQLLQAN